MPVIAATQSPQSSLAPSAFDDLGEQSSLVPPAFDDLGADLTASMSLRQYRRTSSRLWAAAAAATALAVAGLALGACPRIWAMLSVPEETKGSLLSRAEIPEPGPRAQTFYIYRAQSEADYPLENLNAADLAGVLWYLHNEVVPSTPRKYRTDRIKRWKVTVKNTWEFWNVHKRQFGAFVAFDAGRCTTPVCQQIYHQYGFIVGCQVVDSNLAAYYSITQTNWNCKKDEDKCNSPLWYSLPGPCPSMGMSNDDINPNAVDLDVNKHKTSECLKRMPGGHCSNASGAADCTYNYEEAGEILLDELVGIDDYNHFWNTSFLECSSALAKHERNSSCVHNKEYVKELDTGIGLDFWNGQLDKAKCADRLAKAHQLFKKKFPDMPELDEPVCDFDMYYQDEFTWTVNHNHSVKYKWWDHQMEVHLK